MSGRDCPDSQALHKAFRKQAKRKQRHSDGTISVAGIRFEVPDAYHSLVYISVRYAHWDLSVIDMIDSDTSTILAPLYPQNKSANADGLRRLRTSGPINGPQPQKSSASATPPYLQKLLSDYAATGLPPSYIPKDEIGDPQ